MKTLAMGILSAALIAGPAMAVEGIDVTKHRNAVSALLAEKAVPWNRVERVVVEPVYRPNAPITDVMAFVHLTQCRDGYLVVRLNRAGDVTQSYTRNDCKIAGFENYN
tara:strand:- start:351 stop:674 length:324 start_codon:yes stop_codon:yes gene_type:complete